MRNFRRLVLGLVLVSFVSSLQAGAAWRDNGTPFSQEILSYHPTFFGARPVLLEAASNNNVRAQYLYATLIRTYYRHYDQRYWCQWMTVAAINGDENARGAWKGCLLEDAEYELLVQKAAFDDGLKDDLIIHRFHRNWLKLTKQNEPEILDPLIELATKGDLWANFWLAASHNLGFGSDKNRTLACSAYNELTIGIRQGVGSLKFEVDGKVKDWDVLRYEAEGFYYRIKELPHLVHNPTGAFWITPSAKKAAMPLMPKACGLSISYAAAKEAMQRRAEDLKLEAQLLAEQRAVYEKKQDWLRGFVMLAERISNREFAEAKKLIQRLTSTRENAPASDAFAIGEFMTNRELPELYSPEDALGWFLLGDHNQSRNKAYQKFGSAMTADELSSAVPQLIAESMKVNGVAGRLAARVLVESENSSNLYAAYYLAKFFKNTKNLKRDYFRNAPYTKRRALWTSRELLDEVERKLTSYEFLQASNRYDSCMGLADAQGNSQSENRFKRCLLAQLNSTPITLAPAGFTLANETPDTNDLYLTELERVEVTEFYKELATRERERERERDREKRLAENKEKKRLRNLVNQFQVKPTTDNNQDDWQKQLKDLLESDNPMLETN